MNADCLTTSVWNPNCRVSISSRDLVPLSRLTWAGRLKHWYSTPKSDDSALPASSTSDGQIGQLLTDAVSAACGVTVVSLERYVSFDLMLKETTFCLDMVRFKHPTSKNMYLTVDASHAVEVKNVWKWPYEGR